MVRTYGSTTLKEVAPLAIVEDGGIGTSVDLRQRPGLISSSKGSNHVLSIQTQLIANRYKCNEYDPNLSPLSSPSPNAPESSTVSNPPSPNTQHNVWRVDQDTRRLTRRQRNQFWTDGTSDFHNGQLVNVKFPTIFTPRNLATEFLEFGPGSRYSLPIIRGGIYNRMIDSPDLTHKQVRTVAAARTRQVIRDIIEEGCPGLEQVHAYPTNKEIENWVKNIKAGRKELRTEYYFVGVVGLHGWHY
jgi:hypothetical protein